MFRTAYDDNIFIKSSDDSTPDTTSEKENLILKHTLEIANLTALKFELEIVLGRFNKRSPGSVDLIFPNVQIKEKKMKPYIIYMISENNFKALDKHQALDDGAYLIKKNDGGYQLWGCKEENTWRLTDIGIKDLAYLNIKDLEPSETQFNYKFLFVNPNTPLFNALKKAHDSVEIVEKPPWKNAAKFLSEFSFGKVITGFEPRYFSSFPHYASIKLDATKMQAAITKLSLLPAPTNESIENQHRVRR